MDAVKTRLVHVPSALGIGDYPHIWQPPKSIPFNRVGSKQNILSGATFGIAPLAPGQQNQILIPLGQKGWLTQIGVFLSTFGDGQTWSLTQSGKALRDYTNVTVPLGSLATPLIRSIELFPNQPIVLSFFNGSASLPLTVGWSMYGWFYPQR